MRIANYYEGPGIGRNDGNPLYVTQALKRMGIECDHVRPTEGTELIGKYDAHIWCDWGEDGLTGVLPYAPVFPVRNGRDPVVYWPTDTHVNGESYAYRLSLARKSDIVFTAQKITVEQFAKDGVKAEWLPCGVEPLAYPRYELASKHNDICFVGHINGMNRVEFLDRMFREFPNFFYGQRLFEDAAHVYADSKICLNNALNHDINMRCFEVTGSGGFLLTSRIDSLNELFVDGKEIVMYDSVQDAVNKCAYYLEHDEEREAIAKAGYERSLKEHKISDRVDVILNAIKKFKGEL